MKRITQLAFWASLAFLALSLLAFSGTFQTFERLAGFTAISNVLRYGKPDLHQLAWAQPAHSGNFLPAVWMAPFIRLGYAIPRLNAIQMALLGEAMLAAAAFGVLIWFALWAVTGRRRFSWAVVLISLMGIVGLMATQLGPLLTGITIPLWFEGVDDNGLPALHLFLPPAVILLMAAGNLVALLRPKAPRSPMPVWAGGLLALLLLSQMMLSASHLTRGAVQAADGALLEMLANAIQPGDTLLVSVLTPHEAQEVSLRLLAYDGSARPTYVWPDADSELANQNRVWNALHPESAQVWLFERDLLPTDPLRPMAAHLGQMGFPLKEQWIEDAGRLSLYGLAQQAAVPVTVGVPFEAGLSLLDFSILNQAFSLNQAFRPELS